MTTPLTKTARHARIAAILAREQVRSQEELADLLERYASVHVTQATLSRDLDELGVVRLRAGGALVYAPSRSTLSPARLRGALRRLLPSSLVPRSSVQSPPRPFGSVPSHPNARRLTSMSATLCIFMRYDEYSSRTAADVRDRWVRGSR